MTDDSEEPLALSADALTALREFYAERDAQTEKLEQLKALAEGDESERGDGSERVGGRGGGNEPELSIHTFTEDWNESQFWYSDETANLLANQLLDGTSDKSAIAVVSTPSVFVALKNIMTAAGYTGPKPTTYLLEHDHRFAVFPEFVFYDFAHPFKLPASLKGAVDGGMICDPPFLSDDCQTKMAMTLRWLARKPSTSTTTTSSSSSSSSSSDAAGPRVLICTGERMEPLVGRLYRPLGVRTTTYEPVHAGLKNEFLCYANFECDAWQWKEAET
ncbi:putative n-6 adenine-specific DNA methyltransferase 2 [Rosellinia necatrix]|uniref:Protein-lysine N-methyltransferase EFM5 n=1 Tax=Rosellinia necatrix TaxID=77044 RepID=A0A1S7UP68_ROSNE|nr:putative n-6 adenine-specific DNA methyltransferase 2 [Rosellinia necatrix]